MKPAVYAAISFLLTRDDLIKWNTQTQANIEAVEPDSPVQFDLVCLKEAVNRWWERGNG